MAKTLTPAQKIKKLTVQEERRKAIETQQKAIAKAKETLKRLRAKK